ncbi:MAG: glycosyltransferase [Gemmatimonadota bacterium]
MTAHVADRLVLVVPCYNEALRLDTTAFTNALAERSWLDLLFVDDGSTDRTLEMLQTLERASGGRVTILALTTNAGKAEAVRRGLLAACESGAPLCGFWDADLAAPLAEIDALRATFSSRPATSWVWGIRLRALGRNVVRRALRHYLGRVFATATSLVLHVDAYDTQCGAKLFRCAPLLKHVLSEPFRSRWIFDVELLVRADSFLRAGGTAGVESAVYEQPLASWRHVEGSKVGPVDFLRAARELSLVRRDRVRWERSSSSGPR